MRCLYNFLNVIISYRNQHVNNCLKVIDLGLGIIKNIQILEKNWLSNWSQKSSLESSQGNNLTFEYVI